MSKVQPTTTIYRSAIALANDTGSSVIQERESAERCFSHTSTDAERRWKPPVMRSMHCITNTAGEVLTGIQGNSLQWSSNPLDAVASGHAWLSSTVAAARLHRLRDLLPIATLGLALIVLRQAGDGEWEVVNTREFGMSSRQEQRGEANV